MNGVVVRQRGRARDRPQGDEIARMGYREQRRGAERPRSAPEARCRGAEAAEERPRVGPRVAGACPSQRGQPIDRPPTENKVPSGEAGNPAKLGLSPQMKEGHGLSQKYTIFPTPSTCHVCLAIGAAGDGLFMRLHKPAKIRKTFSPFYHLESVLCQRRYFHFRRQLRRAIGKIFTRIHRHPVASRLQS